MVAEVTLSANRFAQSIEASRFYEARPLQNDRLLVDGVVYCNFLPVKGIVDFLVAKSGLQRDGCISAFIGCWLNKRQIFKLLQFDGDVVIFLHVDVQPIRAAFDIPHLDVLGFQVMKRGIQLVDHPLAFGNVGVSGMVVGSVKLDSGHVALGAPLHAVHGIEGIVEDVGVAFHLLLVVDQILFQYGQRHRCPLVHGFDGVADKGGVEGHHRLGHGGELAYAVDFGQFRKLVKMLT